MTIKDHHDLSVNRKMLQQSIENDHNADVVISWFFFDPNNTTGRIDLTGSWITNGSNVMHNDGHWKIVK